MNRLTRLPKGQRWIISACLAALWLIFLLLLVLSYKRISVRPWPPLPGFYAALVSIAHADPVKPDIYAIVATGHRLVAEK
jgi:hypothetical protein